jgi:hypothetical protein
VFGPIQSRRSEEVLFNQRAVAATQLDRLRHLALQYWLSAIRVARFLIQNKLDPASNFIVTLLTFPPTQMLIELAGILVSGLAF